LTVFDGFTIKSNHFDRFPTVFDSKRRCFDMAGTNKSGRKPTATTEKKLRGNPGKRAINHDEPQAKLYDKMPPPPDWLGEHAVEAWNRNGPVLIEMYLLTEADFDLFASLCQNIHILIVSSQDINKNGMTIIGQRGRTRNPALATFAAASTALRGLSSEFGMTPSSRTRFKLPGDQGESLEDFLANESKESDVE
jgi:P27 family predicted phage terminase small subunit